MPSFLMGVKTMLQSLHASAKLTIGRFFTFIPFDKPKIRHPPNASLNTWRNNKTISTFFMSLLEILSLINYKPITICHLQVF
jgi:hypothetical protein